MIALTRGLAAVSMAGASASGAISTSSGDTVPEDLAWLDALERRRARERSLAASAGASSTLARVDATLGSSPGGSSSVSLDEPSQEELRARRLGLHRLVEATPRRGPGPSPASAVDGSSAATSGLEGGGTRLQVR